MSQPILYEQEFREYPLAVRCKLLPEMLGLTQRIKEVAKRVSKEAIEIQATTFADNDPAFLFDFAGNLRLALPFELKKIRLN